MMKIVFPFSQNGRTALLLAADHGNAEVVKILVESGANPDATDIVSTTYSPDIITI